MMDDMHTGYITGRRVEMMQERAMNRFDTDGSGGISIAEAGDFGRLARNFTRIDANDDGVLSASELNKSITERMEMRADRQAERMNAMAAWMNMQESEDQKVVAFDQIDVDGDGMLSSEELTSATETARAAEVAEQLRQDKIAEIARMDLDGNGQLSADELQAELDARMAAQNIATFDGLDTDGDGMLSDAEIAAEVAAQTPPADTTPADDMAPTDSADMSATETMPAEETVVADPMPQADDMAMADDTVTEVAAEAAPVSSADTEEEPDAISLIENVFEDMLDDRGESVSLASLASMTQSLYAQAQEILMDQLEQAAETVGEPGNQDDDQVAYT